eukprot:6262680-Amphidinium_carterae.1
MTSRGRNLLMARVAPRDEVQYFFLLCSEGGRPVSVTRHARSSAMHGANRCPSACQCTRTSAGDFKVGAIQCQLAKVSPASAGAGVAMVSSNLVPETTSG